MKSYPNQKIVNIMKAPTSKKNTFMVLNLEALSKASSLLSNSEFKLYVYLASNQDGYAMALSKRAFCDWANCQENTYRSAVNGLIEKGYLVFDTGNVFTFVEEGSTEIPSKIEVLPIATTKKKKDTKLEDTPSKIEVVVEEENEPWDGTF